MNGAGVALDAEELCLQYVAAMIYFDVTCDGGGAIKRVAAGSVAHSIGRQHRVAHRQLPIKESGIDLPIERKTISGKSQ